MKILIIRLSAIGDIVHCLPIAAQIKRSIPEAEIAWIVEENAAELIVNNPCVDRAIIFPIRRWRNQIKDIRNWAGTICEAKQFLSELGAHRYDVAIDAQGLLKSALIAYASGAKIRLGFKNTRECADKLLTHAADVGDYFGHDRPVVELNLCLAEYLFNLLGLNIALQPVEFPLPPCPTDSINKVEQILSSITKFHVPPAAEPISNMALNTSCERIVRMTALIAGTTWSSKIWPEQNWCELAVTLGKRLRSNIVLVGGQSELEVNKRIAETFRQACSGLEIVNLTGKTTLLDLAALFRRCELVIGADTGPLHIAAATGFPTVIGVYGSTPRHRNGPYGSQCRTVALDLECQPCFSKTCRFSTVACLRDLTVERVFQEIIDGLNAFYS